MIDIEKLKEFLANRKEDWDEEKVSRIANYLVDEMERFVDQSAAEETVLNYLSSDDVLSGTYQVRVSQDNYYDVVDNKLILTALKSGTGNMNGAAAAFSKQCVREAADTFMGLPLYFSYQRTEDDVMGYVSDVNIIERGESIRVDVEITFVERTDDFIGLLNSSLIETVDLTFESTNVAYDDVEWVSDLVPIEIAILDHSLSPLQPSVLNPKTIAQNSKITVGLTALQELYVQSCVKASKKQDAHPVDEFVFEKP